MTRRCKEVQPLFVSGKPHERWVCAALAPLIAARLKERYEAEMAGMQSVRPEGAHSHGCEAAPQESTLQAPSPNPGQDLPPAG